MLLMLLQATITSIHGEYEDGFKKAKIFAGRETDKGVEKMINRYIDNLL